MVSSHDRADMPAPDLAAFGHRVAVLRRERGMTLEDLAEATGVSRQTIINIENAHKIARLDTTFALAHALGVPLAALVSVL